MDENGLGFNLNRGFHRSVHCHFIYYCRLYSVSYTHLDVYKRQSESSYQNAVIYAKDRLQMRSLTGPKNPTGPADPIIVLSLIHI